MFKKNIRHVALLCALCTLLSSCEGHKQGAGTGIGALAGGILGAQFGKGSGKFVTAGLGALAGGLIGNSIGKSLDEHDKMMAERASQNALESSPSGTTVAWQNPDNGNSGTITPTKTYKLNNGRYCREYTQTINVGGKAEKAYGKACRQPDGAWEIVQ